MSWPNKETITQSVIDMLRVNMNLKDGEKLLVVSDVPRLADWQLARQEELTEALERVILARQVCEIAREHFPQTTVQFLPFTATGGHGKEPDEKTAVQMGDADVLLCLTHYSLSHTDARQKASPSGRTRGQYARLHPRYAGSWRADGRRLQAGGGRLPPLCGSADRCG